MTVPLACLLAFATWTMLLVIVGIGYPRVSAVLAGRAKAGDFRADVPHGSDTYRRTMRAHANCVENLPIFAAVVIVAHLVGVRTQTFDTLAIVYVVARAGQSIAHISSGRSRAVLARFTFFSVQIAAVAAMLVLTAIA
jgi:uncharacterized MAPEG superfamily protein